MTRLIRFILHTETMGKNNQIILVTTPMMAKVNANAFNSSKNRKEFVLNLIATELNICEHISHYLDHIQLEDRIMYIDFPISAKETIFNSFKEVFPDYTKDYTR